MGNINPLKEKFSFRDPVKGTDLKISLDNLPLFWKKRIKKIDINKNIDKKKLDKAAKENKKRIYNVYKNKENTNPIYYFVFVMQYRFRTIIKRMLKVLNPLYYILIRYERRYGFRL
jgi:hypothetical protein